ncbi:DUF397 domain-containing protein [Streptomyces sp. NBC_00424]|uniref:DUF397 domain-containing protein n=1 Tax=Streptomyces sp. NBC_00424 TaxID=2903648 RepID=UPI00224EAAF5|nr:DUF397 domain-containing protein [Streptomyces sp. NBC_00424]MCX5078924.1 DUF397 domain-containing protein [Streptomyces sp. NBC_00424]
MTDGINWQKSSFSGADNNQSCVELAPHRGAIVMRESDEPDVVVTTSVAKLRAFILGVKAGEFDHLL